MGGLWWVQSDLARALECELAEARQRLSETQAEPTVVYDAVCIYCGWRSDDVGPDDVKPLAAIHAASCAAHPLRAAEQYAGRIHQIVRDVLGPSSTLLDIIEERIAAIGANSKLSDFVRNATEEERREVFERVIDKSIERQNAVVDNVLTVAHPGTVAINATHQVTPMCIYRDGCRVGMGCNAQSRCLARDVEAKHMGGAGLEQEDCTCPPFVSGCNDTDCPRSIAARALRARNCSYTAKEK